MTIKNWDETVSPSYLFLSFFHFHTYTTHILSRFLTLFYSFYETQERDCGKKLFYLSIPTRAFVCKPVCCYVSVYSHVYMCAKYMEDILCLITRRFASPLISQIDKLSLVYLRDFCLRMCA